MASNEDTEFKKNVSSVNPKSGISHISLLNGRVFNKSEYRLPSAKVVYWFFFKDVVRKYCHKGKRLMLYL